MGIRGLIIFCLLLLSSQSFAQSCEELLNGHYSEEFYKEIKLLSFCMIYEGANLIEQGETGRDNVINKSLTECGVDFAVARRIAVDAGCSKTDSAVAAMIHVKLFADEIYSYSQTGARAYAKPDTELMKGMKRWLFEKD
jgi:hypothetical protein